MAGTVAKHSHMGDEVTMVVCTLGVREPDDESRSIRENEAYKAAGILGARLRILDYPVLKANKPSKEFEQKLSKIIRDLNPDRVYVHSPFDYHQIHETVNEIAVKATADIKQLLFYEVVSSSTSDFKPNAYVDITNFMDYKVKSIQAHRSQGNKIYIRGEVIKSLAHARYIMGKIGFNPTGMAESFMIGRFIIDKIPQRIEIRDSARVAASSA